MAVASPTTSRRVARAETVSDTGGAVDIQVYNATSFITTGGGPVGADLTLGTGNAVVTSVGADVIQAGSGSATLILQGAATVLAGSGALSIYGRGDIAGATVFGNGGNYLFSGDTGNITYYGGAQASTVTAQLGNCRFIGGAGQLTVLGGSAETITGGAGGLVYNAIDDGGADTITTQVGASDTLSLANTDNVFAYGNDVIAAGTANQSISIYGNSLVQGSTGNSMLLFAGRDTLVGAGYDQCTVLAGANLNVTAGNLEFVSEQGAAVQIANAGAGAASLSLAGGAATITAGAWVGPGISVRTDAGTSTAVTLGLGPDTVVSVGVDLILAGAGPDTIQFQSGGSTVIGGTGQLNISNQDYSPGDTHWVQGGSGSLAYAQATGTLDFTGGAGAATIDGGGGSLSVLGGLGNLSVTGGQTGLSFVAGTGVASLALSTGGATVEFGGGSTNAIISYGAPDIFQAVSGHGGGSNSITGFRAGIDMLSLQGVSVTAETVGTSSTTLVLSDNTQITLAGFTTPQALGLVSPALQVLAGAVLDLTSSTLLPGFVTGGGTLQLDSGTYVANGSISTRALVIAAGATLTGSPTLFGTVTSAGTLAANSGTLALTGTDLLGGTLTGPGTIALRGATTLAAGTILQARAILETGSLALSGSGVFTNAAEDSYAMQSEKGSTVALSTSGTATLTNAGSFAASGGGTSAVSVAFINAGLLSAGSGTLSFLGTVTNNGAMTASGMLSVASQVGGSGTLNIAAGGTLSLLAGSGTGETVNFLAGTGLLDLTKPATFLGHIAGFGASDHIDLLKQAATSVSYVNGTLSVLNAGKTVASLTFSGNYTSANFAVNSDGHNGSIITFHA